MEKIKAIVCVLFGHSRIVETFFGYVYCGRCENQIGDTLGGCFNLADFVIKGHNCHNCKINYQKLILKDKFLVSNPFTKDE